jgi:flagellin
MLAYNWDLWADAIPDNGDSLVDLDGLGKHIVGRYTSGVSKVNGSASGTSITSLINLVNQGSQSRIQIHISGGQIGAITSNDSAIVICIGNERYYNGSGKLTSANVGSGSVLKEIGGTGDIASIVTAINQSSLSYWAIGTIDDLWVFNRNTANGSGNSLTAGYRSFGTSANVVTFINQETNQITKNDGQFSLGGRHWVTIDKIPENGTSFNIALNGQNAGEGYDIKIVTEADNTFLSYMPGIGPNPSSRVASSITSKLVQVQDALDGTGSVRTQATAQRALESLNTAIEQKDRIRANLGAMQNRLEATIENLTIQAENLQAAESRISDVDVATEMTEYTKNNILAQAAASMLAQANSLSSLALTLIRG